MSTWLKIYEKNAHPLAHKLKYVERFKVLRTDDQSQGNDFEYFFVFRIVIQVG
jgi:hypothetical protein